MTFPRGQWLSAKLSAESSTASRFRAYEIDSLRCLTLHNWAQSLKYAAISSSARQWRKICHEKPSKSIALDGSLDRTQGYLQNRTKTNSRQRQQIKRAKLLLLQKSGDFQFTSVSESIWCRLKREKRIPRSFLVLNLFSLPSTTNGDVFSSWRSKLIDVRTSFDLFRCRLSSPHSHINKNSCWKTHVEEDYFP